ncbi:Ig-like domain-containing protein [bacterium]|nr:Ig-like domain-containing protein [bacterium]
MKTVPRIYSIVVLSVLISVIIVFLLSCASGGDGGGSSDSDTPLDGGTDTSTDVTAPQVVSITPADGSQDIDPETSITITFSEALDESTIGTSTTAITTSQLTLLDVSADTLIPITISLDETGKTVTLTPSSTLSSAKTYQTAITVTVADLAGNTLAEALSYDFITGTVITGSVSEQVQSSSSSALNQSYQSNLYQRSEPQVAGNNTVKLIEIDSSGGQVGDTIAESTIDSNGNFRLLAPTDFAPSSDLIVQAEVSDGNLCAFVSGTDIDISPETDAALFAIVDTVSDLSQISFQEIELVRERVRSLNMDLIENGMNGKTHANAIKSGALKQHELYHFIKNAAFAGGICATVLDSSDNPLEDIRVIIMGSGDEHRHGEGLTDANGEVCINLKDGEYIILAVNGSSSNFSAGGWYKNRAVVHSFSNSEIVSVSGNEFTDKEIVLPPGARINGTVKTDDGDPLEGFRVYVFDAQYESPVTWADVNSSGNFSINITTNETVKVMTTQLRGDYLALIWNDGTTQAVEPYGGEVEGFSLSANGIKTIDFEYGDSEKGSQLSGIVTTHIGTPVSGEVIWIFDGTGDAMGRSLTNRAGEYKANLGNGEYVLICRGVFQPQTISGINETLDFAHPVGVVTTTLKDGSFNPVGYAKTVLRYIGDDSDCPNDEMYPFLQLRSVAYSQRNGEVALYVSTGSGHQLSVDTTSVPFDLGYAVFDNSESPPSLKHDTCSNSYEDISVSIPGEQELGTLDIPASGTLKGNAYYCGPPSSITGGWVGVYIGSHSNFEFFFGTHTDENGYYEMKLPPNSDYTVYFDDDPDNSTFSETKTNVNIIAGQDKTEDFQQIGCITP